MAGAETARRASPVCTFTRGSGPEKECTRGSTSAQCQGQPKRRPRVAVAHCMKPAMAEIRRWNIGDGVPAPAVDYGS
jgi:hypothetical protein